MSTGINLNSIGISSDVSAGAVSGVLSSNATSLISGSVSVGGVTLSGTALLKKKFNDSMAVGPSVPAFAMGTQVFNAGYISALASQIQNVTNCAALQILVQNALSSIEALIQAEIKNQLQILEDFLPILNLPTDPLAILSWAEKLVLGTVLPQLKAYIAYAQQLIQTLQALQQLEQAIQQAEKNVIACAISLEQTALSGAQAMVSNALTTTLSSIGAMQVQINSFAVRVNPTSPTSLSLDVSSPQAFTASVSANTSKLSIGAFVSA